MQSSLYVSLSGLVATSKRLDTVAHNMANASTAGFRAEEVKFSEVMAKAGADRVSFSSTGDTFISRQAGAVDKTDNPLDFAISGNGYFQIQTPAGIAYTRDGRFQINAEGTLQTLTGLSVLDAGGAPVAIPADGGAITVGRDGSIMQGEIQVGVIGIVELPSDAKLTRGPNSGVYSNKPGVAVQDFTTVGVMQGYSEGSNVNPIAELTKMINLQRTFDSAMTGTREVEETVMSAIKGLGPNS